MKKVLIFAYYFPPLGWSGVQRTLKFVKYLNEFGWEPTIVTVGKTKFDINDTTLEGEIPKSLNIIRIDDIKLKEVTDEMKAELQSYTNNISMMINNSYLKAKYEKEIENKFEELRNLLLIPDGNAIWANKVINSIEEKIDINKFDIIYTTSSPYSSHLIGNYIKEKYNIPWVADFRDEWVNNGDYIFDEESLKYLIEKDLEETVVKNSDKIITTTPYASDNFKLRYNLSEGKVITITNGYDEEDFKDIFNPISKNEKFTIVHNGSCYLNRSPETFFTAVVNLIKENQIDQNSIRIIFVGKNDHQLMEKSKKEIDNYNIVEELGYVSHSESLQIAINSDLLLLILGDLEKQKNVYPGKIFEYFRIGKPILAISPKESGIEELIINTNSGKNIPFRDIKDIEKFIKNKYDNWLNQTKEEECNNQQFKKFERRILTQQLSEVFNKLI